MKQKKFAQEVRHADPEKLEKMYQDLLGHESDYGTRIQLDTLSILIGTERAEELGLDWYDKQAQKLDRQKYRLLTGYGQCQGLLMARGNDIVSCCCDKMAKVVAYGHVHYFDGRIFIPGYPSDPCEKDGAIYILSKNRGYTVNKCPFCGAPITECLPIRKDRKKTVFEDPAGNKTDGRQ
ncbi:MAG: hypothetical protein PHF83_04335 [Candidatus Methanomethylophilus sp.]|nr:hypothetical protein [Methanomethylophilus sp.]